MILELSSEGAELVRSALESLPIRGPVFEVRDLLTQIDTILDQLKQNGTPQNPSR